MRKPVRNSTGLFSHYHESTFTCNVVSGLAWTKRYVDFLRLLSWLFPTRSSWEVLRRSCSLLRHSCVKKKTRIWMRNQCYRIVSNKYHSSGFPCTKYMFSFVQRNVLYRNSCTVCHRPLTSLTRSAKINLVYGGPCWSALTAKYTIPTEIEIADLDCTVTVTTCTASYVLLTVRTGTGLVWVVNNAEIVTVRDGIVCT